MIAENSYGVRKRLEFVDALVRRAAPRAVLDVGCGTGATLLGPLAAAHPGVRFVGADDHAETLRVARELHPLSNLTYALTREAPAGPYDLVIASEVLEHVEEPVGFVRFLFDRLAEGGRVVLTVPNGYGPFEWVSLLETLLVTSGAYGAMRAAKRAVLGAGRPIAAVPDTYAVSPHINFFSWGALQAALAAAGAEVEEYRARTWLCGFGFDSLLRGEASASWNARVADRLPPQAVSDWMLLLRKGAPRAGGFRRNAYARFRRHLNEKRWGLR